MHAVSQTATMDKHLVAELFGSLCRTATELAHTGCSCQVFFVMIDRLMHVIPLSEIPFGLCPSSVLSKVTVRNPIVTIWLQKKYTQIFVSRQPFFVFCTKSL
jgi:hypothetical protein